MKNNLKARLRRLEQATAREKDEGNVEEIKRFLMELFKNTPLRESAGASGKADGTGGTQYPRGRVPQEKPSCPERSRKILQREEKTQVTSLTQKEKRPLLMPVFVLPMPIPET
jgi:hypothetical protein